MRCLITGISGFVGSHLAEALLKESCDVYGLIRYRSKLDNIQHIIPKLHLEYGDIRDAHSVEYVLKKVKPDYIFHLASQSFVPQSWTAPLDTMDTNIKGTINLYEAVRKLGLNCVIHFAGSSEEYGLVRDNETPITEDNALRPLSPYGVSKVAGDKLSCQYVYSYGMKIVVTRAFNHTGARRGEQFVSSNFAKQIAEIEKGARAVIKVGNLKAERDFTDVRDMVKAYLLAVQKCQYGTPYNICSEKAITIESLLNRLLSKTNVCVKVEEDKERMRPSDVPILLGSCTLFKDATGWVRTYSLDDTLDDLLDYWRKRC